jgi:hypothetical protein
LTQRCAEIARAIGRIRIAQIVEKAFERLLDDRRSAAVEAESEQF